MPSRSLLNCVLLAGGLTICAAQARGQACTAYAIAPVSQNFTYTGGTGLVTLNASPAGCTSARTASSNAAWITIAFGQTGNGAGSVGYSVQTNALPNSRTGTITIAGQAFTVNQQGLDCTFTITPGAQTFAAEGGSGAITVNASPSGCQSARTAVSNANWITVNTGASGNGAGTVTYTVQANTASTQRTGTITVAGRTFTVTQTGLTCTFSITPSSAAFQAAGGNGQITIGVSPSNCSSTRTAISNNNWITISFGAAGTGGGTVGYTVAANNFLAERTGTITVAGQTFTVTQAAGSCALTLSPSAATIPAAGGASGFNVTATNSECNWAAAVNADWVRITSGTAGTGNGRVEFEATPNALTSSRTASITLGSATFNITQPGTCTYTLNPVSVILTGAGGTGSFQVQTQGSNCAWTATSNAEYITLTGSASGTGNGTVNYSVAANLTGLDRNGVVTVANQGFTVFQNGSCTYALSTTSVTMPSSGGSGTLTITTTCPWTASSSDAWLGVVPASGTGNTTLRYTVEGNSTGSPRNGSIVIGGQLFSVRQEGITCEVTIDPVTASFAAGGDSLSISVTAIPSCGWTASTTASWIGIAGGVGSGDGGFTITIAPNTQTQTRTGVVTVANRQLTVTQAAATCNYTLSPQRAAFEIAGGSGTFGIATTCAWTAVSQAPWITVAASSASGTGNGTVSFTVPRLTSSEASRTGVIRVGTESFTVTQTAGACVLSVQPQSVELPGAAGRGTVQVTGTSSCRWEPSNDADWFTITSWTNVSGGGPVNYSYTANPLGTSRQAVLRVMAPGVEPQAVVITQGPVSPRINAGGVVNGATMQAGAVSPGAIITIFGQSLGPARLAGAQLTSDGTALERSIADVEVLVDGIPAPIIYASATQVAALVPYAVAGKESVRVVVRNQGIDSAEESVRIAAAAPGIFTANSTGRGQAAALNQDGSLNSATAAVARNQIVTLFLTGEGLLRPDGVDGQITAGTPLPVPQLPVTVQIGGQNAVVLYAGSAPGLVAGVMQVNARVAANATVGAAVPVVVRVGTFASPAGVTVAVR